MQIAVKASSIIAALQKLPDETIQVSLTDADYAFPKNAQR